MSEAERNPKVNRSSRIIDLLILLKDRIRKPSIKGGLADTTLQESRRKRRERKNNGVAEGEDDKVAFIDVDGVLVPAGSDRFSEYAIKQVKHLQDSGFKIVLSSTWRLNPIKFSKIQAALASHGVVLYGRGARRSDSKLRYAEGWLDDYYGPVWPKVIVMFDDYPIVKHPSIQSVQVDSRYGLYACDVMPFITAREG